MSSYNKHGKRRQITFRIGPLAEDRLRQVAKLFNMKPTEYAKAVLYRDLGVFNEPLDQRRRSWRRCCGEKDANNNIYAEELETDADIDSELELEDEEPLRPGRHNLSENGLP